jgi:hypothetical protein
LHLSAFVSLWVFNFICFCNIKVKSTGDTEPAKAKAKAAKPAKPAAKEVSEKENEVSVSLLNIQVGLIRKAWKHPSADRYFGKPTKEFFYNLNFWS